MPWASCSMASYSFNWETSSVRRLERNGVFRMLRIPICPICVVFKIEDKISLLPFIISPLSFCPVVISFMHAFREKT